MKTLIEFITEQRRDWKSLLRDTLHVDNYPKLYNRLKKYIEINFSNIQDIYLVFKNAEEAQSWVDFTYIPINGEKFSSLDGNFTVNNDIYNKAQEYLEQVKNKNLLENIDIKQKEFPFLEITGFKNKIKVVFSNKMKVDKYNITAYIVEI